MLARAEHEAGKWDAKRKSMPEAVWRNKQYAPRSRRNRKGNYRSRDGSIEMDVGSSGRVTSEDYAYAGIDQPD